MSSAQDLRDVLHGADFRRLFATRLVSQFGDGVLQAGLASYVLFSPERQASATRVAAAFAVLLLPYSALGPFAGVLLDRWRRRHVLVRANLLRAGLVALLAVQVAVGRESLDFPLVALCVLGVNRFFLAGLSAALPHVVAANRLVVANALAPTSGTVASAVGASAGLAARGLLGGTDRAAAGIVLTAGAGYLAAAAIAARFPAARLGPLPTEMGHEPVRRAARRVAGELVDGLRVVARTRRAARALGAIGTHRFMFGAVTVLVVLLQRNAFHSPDDPDAGLGGLALTFAAVGIGVPLGALATPAAVRRLGSERWVALLLAAAGISLLGFGLPLRELPLVGAGLAVGFAGQGIKVAADATLQLTIDDAHLGRVFALYDVVFNVAFVAAAAAAAAVLPADGRSRALMAAIAAGYLLAAAWAGRSG